MAHWAVGLVAEQSSGEVDAGLLMNALLALGLGEGAGHGKRLPQEPVI